MSLFQNSVLNKYLKSHYTEEIKEKWSLFKTYFHNSTIQENIRNSKEEQFQEGFLREMFVKILGYTLNPEPNFNLTTEYKNVKDSKKADGAVIINEIVKAVIELKGTNTTDLNKIELQAFGYKNNQPECEYVITSNFEKIRFYIDNAIEYVEFNLFNLSEKEFELLYICLSYNSIAKGLPKQIKEESVSQEALITKKLYHDYSVFKSELYQSLVKLNPQYEPLELFKKSQKLLDRFLFIFFAEDRNLLPTNLIFRINKEWQQLREMRIEVSLYDRYKIYFNDLDQGATVSLPAFSQTASKQKEEFQIYAYNGGLFKTDDLLNDIKIDDALLFSHTEKLSNYDFASEVDVNVLGHIFENSLNDVDEIKAQLEGQEVDKTKTKRKKDGVFYTPKYITKYIVDNTVGKLCIEKKEELKINEDDYRIDKKRTTKAKQLLLDNLELYRKWLLQLTICDPACGSGAFLNQALDFLIAEHGYIDELQAKVLNVPMVLSDVEGSILENNLFGVDINEESVEIAKLSLWLRTAQPNRKLNDLNSNIKCGNSLIDDVSVAGNSAFNWEQQFPVVFEKGGFDIIIGNPPYVRVEFIDEVSVNYFKNKYKSATSKFDLSSLFFEKSISLLNPRGIYSIITSYQFIYTSSGIGLRKFISENTDCEIIKFSSESQVFSGATTYAGIFIARRNKSETIVIKDANNQNNSINIQKEFKINSSEFSLEKVILDSSNIISKIESNTSVILGSSIGMAKTGVVSSADEIFFLSEEKVKELNLERELIYPILGIDDLNPWILDLPKTLCLYPYKEIENKTSLISLIELRDKYPNIYNYLLSSKEKLSGRSQGRQDYSESEKWYQLNRPREKWIYDSKKIIYPGTTNRPKFAFDLSGQMFRNARVYAFLLKEEYKYLFDEILPILNSSLTKYLLSLKCPPKANNYFEMSTGFMENYPFILPQNDIKIFFQNVSKQMMELHSSFNDVVKKFQRSIERKFELQILPKKLELWYTLNYAEFIKELAKKKVKLSLSDEAEWEEYFNTEAKKALELKSKIDATDKEIDQMVYKLYDLTEEEIKIVEGN